MTTLKTVVINKDGLATVINEKDFQQGIHDLWSDYIPDAIADEVFDDDVSNDEESEEVVVAPAREKIMKTAEKLRANIKGK